MLCARNRGGCYKRRKEKKHSRNKNAVDVKQQKKGQRRENGEKRKEKT